MYSFPAVLRTNLPPKTSPKKELSGKTALITGGNRGIGLAIAHALACHGCNLVVTGRDAQTLKKAGRELEVRRVSVLTSLCDVRDPAAVQALCRAVRRRFRRLDFLINNAGIAHRNQPFENISFETWVRVLDTNLNGVFLVTQCALPLLRRGSVIVNNLSVAAKRAFTGSSAYNASKYGALGLSNTLREELRPRGIRVISLLPGPTNTDIWDTLMPEAPRKTMMSAETVANALVNALLLPPEATVEELLILPSAGVL